MKDTISINQTGDIDGVIAGMRGLGEDSEEISRTVERIIEDVRERGDEAVSDWTARLDRVELVPGELEVAPENMAAALEALDPTTRDALEKAAGRITEFARESIPADWRSLTDPVGPAVGQMIRPYETAGIYVPGGRFPYPSTVLMTGIPAHVAGVEELVYCMPPGKDGLPGRSCLAAAALIGECRVFRIGGAQAIAAMGLGTDSVPLCRMIAGPGNAYVTEAKRQISAWARIDMPAGPSEVAVLADSTADPSLVAADMAAQAEHDPDALTVLVSTDAGIVGSVVDELSRLSNGDASGNEIESANFVICASFELAMEFVNRLAPEHLELMLEDCEKAMNAVKATGCVFVGPYSTVALGDYVAGPSHVLPTGGAALLMSGLRAQDFTRTINFIEYSREAFEADYPQARLLAELEGLDRHAASLDARMRTIKDGGAR